MDWLRELKKLAQARARVALGEKQITRQRKLLAELERDDQNTAAARGLLATLEKMQAQYVAHHRRLEKDLFPDRRP
jgi:hypothetical protein